MCYPPPTPRQKGPALQCLLPLCSDTESGTIPWPNLPRWDGYPYFHNVDSWKTERPVYKLAWTCRPELQNVLNTCRILQIRRRPDWWGTPKKDWTWFNMKSFPKRPTMKVTSHFYYRVRPLRQGGKSFVWRGRAQGNADPKFQQPWLLAWGLS